LLSGWPRAPPSRTRRSRGSGRGSRPGKPAMSPRRPCARPGPGAPPGRRRHCRPPAACRATSRRAPAAGQELPGRGAQRALGRPLGE